MQDALDHADELAARRFEEFEPADSGVDATALRLLREAVLARAAADREIIEAVRLARRDRHSWTAIGAMLGTSGEAARQRYGRLAGDESP
jgi:hypothetical protein